MSENGADNVFDFEPSFKMVFKVTTPAIRWVWDWAKAYKVVLLGPSLAGKTRFLRYLYTLQLSDDEPTRLARAKNRTIVVDNSNGLLALRVGKPPGVLLRIRTVVDSPGLEGAKHAAKLVDPKDPRRGAHVVVLVLDGSKRSETVQWIHEFASHLADILNQAKKLCELFVLINKYDQAKSYYEAMERAVNDKLSASLKPVIGERGNIIKIFRHCSRETGCHVDMREPYGVYCRFHPCCYGGPRYGRTRPLPTRSLGRDYTP